MGTKSNPGRFDCYEKAGTEEPMFILLARDITAPDLVRKWAMDRLTVRENRWDDAQIQEAFKCAQEMEEWRQRPEPSPEAYGMKPYGTVVEDPTAAYMKGWNDSTALYLAAIHGETVSRDDYYRPEGYNS